MIDLYTLLIFVVVLCLTLAYWNARKPAHMPPGPPGYPFLGNIPMLLGNDRIHLTLNSYKKTYGPVISLQFGFYPAVVISSYKLLQQALIKQGEQFANRPNHYLITRVFGNDTGLVNTNGLSWKLCRRLAISSMRDFGVGKSSIEERVKDEAQKVTQQINKANNKPFSLDITFNKASANIMFSVLFGKRYEFDNLEFVDVVQQLSDFFNGASQLKPTFFLPYLLPITIIEIRTVLKRFFSLRAYLNKQIKEHRLTFDADNIRDYVDVYINAENEESDNKVISEENLFNSILDLLLAGTETTSTTLNWAIYFMVTQPHIQEKCQKEIQSLIGDRAPCMSDKNRCSYVDATLCEVQRLSSMVPLSVFRCTNGPVEFEGYKLPDMTIVIPDIYSVHMDPELWQDPKQFQPERFLDENSKCVRPPHFIPFALGKRVCAGENLAKTELFIIFTSLLQKFTFTTNDASSLPGVHEAKLAVTLSPPDFEVIATPVKKQ